MIETVASAALAFVVIAFVSPLAWRLVMLVVHANRMDRTKQAEAMAKLQATMADVQRTAERVKAIAPVLARPSRAAIDRAAADPMACLRIPPRDPRLEFDMTAADGRPVHLENGA